MTPQHTILYLTPSVKLLGARRSLLSLTRGLSPEFRPVVVCPGEGGVAAELKKHGIEVHVIPLYQWRKGKFFFHRYASLKKLRHFIREMKPAVIHCNEFYPLPYAHFAGTPGGVPIVTHIRLAITPRKIRNYHLSSARRIIVVSHSLADQLKGSGLEDRVRVVYNAVEPGDFAVGDSDIDFRKELGLAPNTFLIGHIGSIEPRKRQHITLESLSKVVQKNTNVHVAIVGITRPEHKGYHQQLEDFVREKALSDNVSFIPFRKDIASVYRALDLNILISAEEGFGRTIIESGYLGVPSVGSRVGGIPELIKDGETGQLIDLDDADSLASIILDLAAHPDQRQAMSHAVRQHVEKNFLIAPHCRAIEALYREVINE
jgi:glycosyltransferase involved in cell wall biosynthesis